MDGRAREGAPVSFEAPLARVKLAEQNINPPTLSQQRLYMTLASFLTTAIHTILATSDRRDCLTSRRKVINVAVSLFWPEMLECIDFANRVQMDFVMAIKYAVSVAEQC